MEVSTLLFGTGRWMAVVPCRPGGTSSAIRGYGVSARFSLRPIHWRTLVRT